MTAAAHYVLSVAPDPITIASGLSSDATVTITRTNFPGAVTRSLVNPPTGVSGVFNPDAPTGDNSILTLTVGAGAALGAHTLTVMGTASGVPTRIARAAGAGTAKPGVLNAKSGRAAVSVAPAGEVAGAPGDRGVSFTLNVDPAGSISLAPTPTMVQALQGGFAHSSLAITRTTYTDVVNLTASGAPAGMTIDFSNAAPTGDFAGVDVTVGAGVAVGTYSITITGSGTAILDATTTLDVMVSAPSAVFNVEYQFREFQNPGYFAFQDDDGPWTPVLPLLDAGVFRYRMNMASGFGGVYIAGGGGGSGTLFGGSAGEDLFAGGPLSQGYELLQSFTSAGGSLPWVAGGGGGGGGYGSHGSKIRIYYATVSQHNVAGLLLAIAGLRSTVIPTIQSLNLGDRMLAAAYGRTRLFEQGVDANPWRFGRLAEAVINPFITSFYFNGADFPGRIGILRGMTANGVINPFDAQSAIPALATFIAINPGIDWWGVASGWYENNRFVGLFHVGEPSASPTKTVYAPNLSLWLTGHPIVAAYAVTADMSTYRFAKAHESAWAALKFLDFAGPLSATILTAGLPSSVLARFFASFPADPSPLRYFGLAFQSDDKSANSLCAGYTIEYISMRYGSQPAFLDLPTHVAVGAPAIYALLGLYRLVAFDLRFSGASATGYTPPATLGSVSRGSAKMLGTAQF